MSTTLATQRITPEDLLRMPDGDRYELVDGELREKVMSTQSSYVAGRIERALGAFVESNRLGWVFPEGHSYQCFAWDVDLIRKADASFIALDRLSEEQAMAEGHCPVAPDLVVEVVPPNDLWHRVEEKIEQWLAAGVKEVWVVHPKLKRVSVYAANHPVRMLREKDVIAPEKLLPGFQCQVAEFFRMPTAGGAK